MISEKDLLALKAEMEEAKSNMDKLTGQKTALLEQLKTEWGCSSVEKAREKLVEMDKEINKLKKELEEGCAEIENKYFEK